MSAEAMDFTKQYGPTALVCGGSEGVGAAYAMQLAERGLDLALIARKPGPLGETAAAIRAAHPKREVLTRSVDLTAPGAVDAIRELTGNREIGLLIHNAGASSQTGDFLDSDLGFAQGLVAVNDTAMLALVHHYGGQMKARGRGGIVLVGSFAALVGQPGLATYSAVKAFSTTFAEALWFELKPHGVHVLSHMLGLTATPANARHYPAMAGLGEDSADIARQGLDAIANGPVLYAAGGDDMVKAFASLSRGAAVEQMYQAGAAFRD